MANMTADIEQLLAELIRITTKIAALVNATDTNASNDSGSLTSTTNRLSLSATIIAVAAVFIASLQAILEYSSSDESVRCKCNFAAIGPFSKYVHKRWPFRHWRRKFYYPELGRPLTYALILRPLSKSPNPGHGTRGLTNLKRLLTPGRRVPNLLSQPRATWAQLLSLTGFEGQSALTANHYVDVDSIPGSLDVPPQMMDLVQLGILVVLMGFDSIRMNVRDRDFQAIRRFGPIMTEELTGFGRVVRFQKYYDKLPLEIGLSRPWFWGALYLIGGNFDVTIYDTQDTLSTLKELPLSRPSHRTDMRKEADHMVSFLNESIRREGSKARFNDIYEGINIIPSASVRTAFSQWQGALAPLPTQFKYPSILVTLAITGLPCAVAGFPGRLLLIPFLGPCRQLSQAMYKRCEKTLSSDAQFSNSYILQTDDYRRLMSDTRFSSPLAEDGSSHWAFDATKSVEHNHHIQPYLKSIKERGPLGRKPEEGLFRQWRVILAPIVDLIRDFDPRFWAQKQYSKLGYRDDTNILHSPDLLLKTQIILLDISIHFHLNAMWKTYASQMPFIGTGPHYTDRIRHRQTFIWHVMAAVSRSVTNRDDCESGLFENLDLALSSHLSTHTAATTTYQQQTSEIGEFLRLRVVLYAAYLMIIPDTSDILETQFSVGHSGFILPMI
ncbi:hypothetical protein F5B21DRAFT_348383 [Xylaria acuta]|nr:hypothetical protein F5B21DRAFT_348383 [Xylaria acuta]